VASPLRCSKRSTLGIGDPWGYKALPRVPGKSGRTVVPVHTDYGLGSQSWKIQIYKLTARKGLKATLKALCTLQKDESGKRSSTNYLSNVTYGVNQRNEDSERECWLFGMMEDCLVPPNNSWLGKYDVSRTEGGYHQWKLRKYSVQLIKKVKMKQD
jgi:hypothetical protein